MVEQVSASSGESTNPVRAAQPPARALKRAPNPVRAPARARALASARTPNPVRARAARTPATGLGVADRRGRRDRAGAGARSGEQGRRRRILGSHPRRRVFDFSYNN